jgi:hypothetical protein
MYRYWDAILVLIEKTYLFHASGCILVGWAMPYFKELLGGHMEGAGIQAEFFLKAKFCQMVKFFLSFLVAKYIYIYIYIYIF